MDIHTTRFRLPYPAHETFLQAILSEGREGSAWEISQPCILIPLSNSCNECYYNSNSLASPPPPPSFQPVPNTLEISHEERQNNLFAIQIKHQPDATIFQFIILTFIYSSTCFGRFPAHHQELNDCCGSLWFYPHCPIVVL